MKMHHRLWVVWAVGLAAYLVGVMHRTSFGVAGLDAAARFGAAPVALAGFVVLQLLVYASLQIPVGVLLDHVGLAAGLYLPTESVTKAAERTEAEIAEQMAGSEEVRQVVEALEQQYDTVASGRGERASSMGLSGQLPSADELAAEVERFLAGQDDEDNGRS